MYQFQAEKSPRFAGENHLLAATVFLLTGLGLVVLYSASYESAARWFRDGGLHFVSRQLVAAGLGLVFFFITSRMNLKYARSGARALLIFSFILCILVFVPGIEDPRNGASRWIKVPGGTFQPSELVKLALPLYLAYNFDKNRDGLNKITTGVLLPVLITAFFFLIIYLQNNFSTAAFIAANALVILFLAGSRLYYFFSGIILLLPCAGLLILTKEHRLRRILSFLRPEWDPQGAGYQVDSSMKAIAAGGAWGKGLGQGTKKIASIPEVHSDFIFSAFSEELGFMGVVVVFILFGVFAFLGYRGALRAGDTFRRLLGCGLVTTIITQAMLNIAVVSGSLPVAGLPLPFFSAGGSSLIITLGMAGLLVNVCRSRDDNRFPALSRAGTGGAYGA